MVLSASLNKTVPSLHIKQLTEMYVTQAFNKYLLFLVPFENVFTYLLFTKCNKTAVILKMDSILFLTCPFYTDIIRFKNIYLNKNLLA